MYVAMMDVGPVHVAVRHRLVRVQMVVPPCKVPFLVRVLVVLVVLVGVDVGHPFVPMQVPVQFAVEKEHPREHDQRRHPVLAGGVLA